MNMQTATKFRYSHTVGFMALQGGRGFATPVDMAFDKDGIMYVLSRGGSDSDEMTISKRVTKCTVDEKYLSQFSTGGDGDGELTWPSSIVIDGDERVFVSDDALHRISVFSKEGEFLHKWGRKGDGEGEFNSPAGMALDGDGNLLVVDSLNNRIQRYTTHGVFLSQWGSAGQGEGEFNMPWGIATDLNNDVYVADWRNDRIQKFNPEGRYLASWGGSGSGDGELNRPSGLCVDSEGNLYIADWGNERVQVLAQDGTFLSKFRGESGMSKWAHEYFSANMHEFEEREKADLEPQVDLPENDYLRNESANVEKLFWGPTTVKIDDQGRIYVVDTGRARVQIYTWED